jgi:hypothetical protein
MTHRRPLAARQSQTYGDTCGRCHVVEGLDLARANHVRLKPPAHATRQGTPITLPAPSADAGVLNGAE